MKYRKLGNTGLSVSEIGFGAWGIGGRTKGTTSYGDTDDSISLAALDRAIDKGITFFDTSNVYGDGHSEELLGTAFGHRRDKVVIASKAGFVSFDRPLDFSAKNLRYSVEGSLRRLRSDYIDLLQLHNPSIDHLRAQPEILGALNRMRDEGKIRAYGFSLKSPQEGIAAIDAFDVPALQVNLNMLDVRAATSGLAARAQQRNVGIIARTPLCFGFLSGTVGPDSTFPDGDHRSGWPREQLARWANGAETLFKAISPQAGQSWAQVALRFCLAFEFVATVIPGILTPEEVDANVHASDLGPMPDADAATVVQLTSAMDLVVRSKA